MKHFVLLYSCFALLTLNCSNTVPQKNTTATLTTQDKELLQGIEQKIFNAFVQANIKKEPSPLLGLRDQLDGVGEKKGNKLLTYWRAYLHYYLSIYHLTQENKASSEDAIDIAVELLDNLKNKNSEDYALLTLVESFSIQFKGFRAMFISNSVKKNGKKALSLEPKNIRAHFVMASSDFYTPEKYGGGKKAEDLLLKAIELPVQLNKNPYFPSWGKQESYELLVKHYLKSAQNDKAKKYCKEGISLFPDNYGLGKLAIQLLD